MGLIFCGHRWVSWIAGQIKLKHQCGEEKKHKGKHRCKFCGMTE